jgi:biotin synthase
MLNKDEIVAWLKEQREDALEDLWHEADRVRKRSVGEDVHLRGLIEISNHCVRLCHYCGLRAENSGVTRYRMTTDEILACAQTAVGYEYGTVVLQSGEDPQITMGWMVDLIRQIKQESSLAVTLSLGERSSDELSAWRQAGADRYLLRFETSNPTLYTRIHPPRPGRPLADRIELLKKLRGIGYEIGSGVMVGIPGQSIDDLANDLILFQQLDLDMIGVGPFIPHPATPLRAHSPDNSRERERFIQVPNSELMTYKVIALARLLCPFSNIPSTTALATLNITEGRELGLQRGANIVMPNLTPPGYRVHYEIYPEKACIRETSEQCHESLTRRIKSIGRKVGTGPGDALAKKLRADLAAHDPISG